MALGATVAVGGTLVGVGGTGEVVGEQASPWMELVFPTGGQACSLAEQVCLPPRGAGGRTTAAGDGPTATWQPARANSARATNSQDR